MVRPLHLSMGLRPAASSTKATSPGPSSSVRARPRSASARPEATARVLLVGNVAYADAVAAAFPWMIRVTDRRFLAPLVSLDPPDLIVVAGWRHLIPPDVLALAPTVGFHSAKLPEYPGRAPVPWTLLRGDRYAWNTLLYLDEGVDSGDIVDAHSRLIEPGDTPETIYAWIRESAPQLLRRHLPGLLAGTAPRTPQDMTRRGPLTTKDGWRLLAERAGERPG